MAGNTPLPSTYWNEYNLLGPLKKNYEFSQWSPQVSDNVHVFLQQQLTSTVISTPWKKQTNVQLQFFRLDNVATNDPDKHSSFLFGNTKELGVGYIFEKKRLTNFYNFFGKF